VFGGNFDRYEDVIALSLTRNNKLESGVFFGEPERETREFVHQALTLSL